MTLIFILIAYVLIGCVVTAIGQDRKFNITLRLFPWVLVVIALWPIGLFYLFDEKYFEEDDRSDR